MALINILPSWVVLLGRDIIRALGGDADIASGTLPSSSYRSAAPLRSHAEDRPR
jgi:hypothetical protein